MKTKLSHPFRRRRALVEHLENRQLLTADPVISEILAINDTGLQDEEGDREDWIEIANHDVEPTSIDGWYLTDDEDDPTKWRIPAVSLEPGEHRVIFASGKDRVDPDSQLHANFKLSGNGEFLALIKPDGTTISDSFTPEFPPQSGDQSYGLGPDGVTTGFFSIPTPGSANIHEPIANPEHQVIINEIMYHPSSELDAEEFIELRNIGSEPVNLLNWQLTSGIDYTFSNVNIPAGGFLVVAADLDVFTQKYGNEINVVGPWTGRLSNRTDQITVRNADRDRIDRVRYADEGDWSVRQRGELDRGTQGWTWSDAHDGGGYSLELINPSMPNEQGQNWSASQTLKGTPGAENSVHQVSTAPFILNTRHEPILPNSDEPVTVTAQLIAAADRELDVALRWRVDGAADFESVPMTDNGINGDRLANDFVYTTTIPALPDLTVVEFYVFVSDSEQNERTWPAATAASGQVTNALYQVIDAFDSDNFWNPGDVPTYYEVMTAAERTEFTNIDRFSNAEMNATFISVNGDGVRLRYNTGIRMRGSGSRRANPPNNRINFPSDDPWQGVTAINLNQDNVHNQVAGSVLFRIAGLPAAEAKPVRMLSNGVDLFEGQFYAHLEPLNSDFADNQFPLDANGNLYKGRRPNESPPGGRGAGLAYQGPDPLPYVSYTKLTNSSEADWSDVIQLTDVLNNSADETYLDDVSQVADIDQWLRFFAMNAVLGNTEGGLVNGDRQGDDYAMYRGIEDPRFVMIPHDLDSILVNVNWSLTRMTFVPALRRLIYHPEIRPRYFQIVHETIDQLNSDLASQAIEQAMAPFGQSRIDAIKDYLSRRATAIDRLAPTELNIHRTYPESNGYAVSERAVADLFGQAPFDAKSITVNGQLASLNNSFQWELGSTNRSLILLNGTWQYLDDGSDQGTAWKEPDFNPQGWKEGVGEFGYGDRGETTIVSFGPDEADKHITTYFRHSFDVTDKWRYQDLRVSMRIDDGAVVFLNGNQVVLDNMPEAYDFDTRALSGRMGGAESTFRTFEVDPNLLNEGQNVIAVEVHQANADSADLSFWLTLVGRYSQNSGINLFPGVNRVTVEARDGVNGTGNVVDSHEMDFWYDDGSTTNVAGTLPIGNTVWSAENGPYLVTENVTVPTDATLTISPGTSVYFAEGTELLIRGTLVANGTRDHRIRFTADPSAPWVPNRPNELAVLPDGPPRWSGVHFDGTRAQENSISFADIHFAQSTGGSIGVVNSHAAIDNVSFAGTHLRMIFGNNASMTVTNSTFPDMFTENESPQQLHLDNVSEHIKIIGRTPVGGVLLVRGNNFGRNKGHNDVIDADSNRVSQGPILQVIGNTFAGAGDEHLDLGGDVYVAENIFLNVFKDDETSDRGYANAISTGDAGRDATIVVAKNLFYDVDHAINLKNETGTIFENNTVVKVHPDFTDRFGNPNVGSVVNLFVDEPAAVAGKGAYLARNLLVDIPRVFGNIDQPENTQSYLEAHDNLIDAAEFSLGDRLDDVFDLGAGNTVGEVRFADMESLDFSLEPGSAGRTIYGSEWGWLSSDIWVENIPASMTAQTTATLNIGGPGLFAYRYRHNNGNWSDPIDIGNGLDTNGTVRHAVLNLTGLSEGEQTLEVQGRDFAGNWSPETAVVSWTVDSSMPGLLINEVLADNRGAFLNAGSTPDAIELVNVGSQPIDLNGLSLSDRVDRPDKFVFTDEMILDPGQYLVLSADDPNPLPGIHTGFALNNDGEGVYLFSAAVNGERELLDSVEFGVQIPDHSIARIGTDRSWHLAEPTIGEENIVTLTGDPRSVRINEWLAGSTTQDEFVELHNSDTLPVAIGGMFLTDELGGAPRLHEIAALSFIDGRGFKEFIADGSPDRGADHLDFRLSLEQEIIGLLDRNGTVIDTILYSPQMQDFSEGRLPDGTNSIAVFEPTPGWPNGTRIPGDFNADQLVTIDDVDALCTTIRAGQPNVLFDLNQDGQVDHADMEYLITRVLNTAFGDSNLDGIFNSADLVTVFVAGKFEDAIPQNSTWADGDWDCDGDFGTRDLVLAFQSGRYVSLAVPAAMDSTLSITPATVDIARFGHEQIIHKHKARPRRELEVAPRASQTPRLTAPARPIFVHPHDRVFADSNPTDDWDLEGNS